MGSPLKKRNSVFERDFYFADKERDPIARIVDPVSRMGKPGFSNRGTCFEWGPFFPDWETRFPECGTQFPGWGTRFPDLKGEPVFLQETASLVIKKKLTLFPESGIMFPEWGPYFLNGQPCFPKEKSSFPKWGPGFLVESYF